jgi:pyrroloquinoline quinone (PQQ) biosynthesis protein C
MELQKVQERVCERVMSNQLVQAMMRGGGSRDQYRAYLTDVYCYARHSAQVIGLAASRLVTSHPSLSKYLFEHAREEMGHDEWVASDLRDLELSSSEIPALEPSSPCLRMIGLEYFYALHGNAVGLFGWMFVLESLGGRIGGGIARTLDQSLRLDGKATYFLTGHGEADAHHSEDLYRVIAEHVTSPADLRAFTRMAQESEDLYCAILDSAYLSTSRGAAFAARELRA